MSLPDILTLIITLLLNSAYIIGIYTACHYDSDANEEPIKDSKMILWRVKYYSLKWFGEFWSKPICTCIICMASIHSLIIWIPIYIIYPFSFWLIYIHIVYITCLAGINKLITLKFEL